MPDEAINSIMDDIKKHPGVAIIFWVLGIVTFLILFYLFGDKFYILKTDIGKDYITKEQEVQYKQQIEKLTAENNHLNRKLSDFSAAQQEMTKAVCDRYAQEVNNIITEQQRVEANIQTTISNSRWASEADRQMYDKSIQNYREYSKQLNQRIMQLQDKLSLCGK